jgi:asparagine synthase (glutamine-hydrolysing)
MCGIAGIWHLDDRPVSLQSLQRFTRSLAHRGPDGEGFHIDDHGTLGLGHRRLAILDLSEAGRQPMEYGDGRYWVTYNGEIYNFLELRRELESYGYVFRTQSDTEIIPAAYDRWGPDCQLKFNGMWAFALWDRREQTLFLSRDRFGIKPLHYLCEPGRRFAFASELKAFLHLYDFTARENKSALQQMLADINSLEGTENTLLEGVKRLPGGHCSTIRDGAVKVWRWWNTLDHLSSVPKTLKQQAEQFRELFFDACRLRLRSDVPVATCLSGGLDSSAVLCTLPVINASSGAGEGAERRTDNWQRAFVATYPGTPLDERDFAEIAIRHAGAVPRYKPMSADAALEDLPRLIYEFEDICGTLPAPVWAIYRELRRDGVVVSLDGHGSDEMLGGYSYYTQTALENSGGLLRNPLRTLDLINTFYYMHGQDGPLPPPSRMRLVSEDPFLRFPVQVAGSIYHGARRLLSVGNRSQSNGSRAAAWVESAPRANGAAAADEEAAIDALGPVNAQLYRDFHRTMLPTILRNFDRCSMAHGIEVRMPFMDWRLVSFVFSLPEKSKIGGGFSKRVLREAMRGIMPEALRTRKSKIGFSSPLPDWFRGPLRTWLLQQVNDQDFISSDVWNGPAIRDFVGERVRLDRWDWQTAQKVWRFLHAHVWRKTFLNGNANSIEANVQSS